jgi:Caspase domain
MRSLATFLLCACLALLVSPARADGPARATVALIVGSNRGALVARPDLHFADDDAARYYETFRMLAADEDLALVTRFDRDSERQFGALRDRARPPTRQNLLASGATLAKRVQSLRAAGAEVDFYFVYAGHGDVDQGSGFLELEDGRFGSSELEALLRSVSATRAHVILDSCNSVFMVSARKPGGQHFATGEAAARQLAARMPEVGVFLSTSAEGEVFEWSELGAGIFSHVVRSGISGAADADGNGAVSYAELRAFVEVATRTVPNPRFRPQVFARGPNGKDDVTLFAPGAVRRGKKLEVSPRDGRRVTLRDADDVPWIDLHCEEAARCVLSVPERAATGATVETYRVDSAGMHSAGRAAFVADDERPTPLASLSLASGASSARGVNESLRALFREPFGPRAFAEVAERPAAPAPVYGVSSSDVERHRLLLRSISNSERRQRLATAAGYLVGGALGTGTGIVVMAREGAGDPWTPGEIFGAVQTAVGAGMLLAAPWAFFTADRTEKLHEEFEQDLSENPDDRAGALARGEQRLFEAAEAARNERLVQLGVSAALAAVQLSIFVGNELRSDPNDAIRYGVGGSLLILGSTAFTDLVPREIERFAQLWREDPSRAWRAAGRRRLELTPTFGGVMLGGRF